MNADRLADRNYSNKPVQLVVCLAVLFGTCLALGLFAVALNSNFYRHHQPFHDSLGYHDKMHEVMTLGREQGMLAALQHACQCNSTVFLPNAVAALLSPILSPSRSIGIWIQVVELTAVVLSLFYFITQIKRQPAAIGFLFVGPVLAMAALYRFNGGLSDFRMDLSLCLMFALSLIWYLTSVETERRLHFLLFGCSAGLACLFRATAPVYLAIAFGPLVVFDVAMAKRRRPFVMGFTIASIAAIGLSAWYYVLNFDQLYYYYFVWNTHANQGLSWGASIGHTKFAFDHIGDASLVMVCIFHAIVTWQRFFTGHETIGHAVRYCQENQPVGDAIYRLPVFGWINYRMLWVATVPTLLLIFRGAGLNPFVSMPSSIGILLFLLLPVSLPRIQLSKPAIAVATATFVCLLGWSCFDGWKQHRPGSINSMAAHQRILKMAEADARDRGFERVSITALHLYSLNARSLRNVTLFDLTPEQTENAGQNERKIRYQFVIATAPAAQADWHQIEGDTDQEKLQTIYQQLNQRVQYLVMPEENSAKYVAQHVQHNVINRFCPELRERILKGGNWVPISEEIQNGPHETVRLFRRVGLPATLQERLAGDSSAGQF